MDASALGQKGGKPKGKGKKGGKTNGTGNGSTDDKKVCCNCRKTGHMKAECYPHQLRWRRRQLWGNEPQETQDRFVPEPQTVPSAAISFGIHHHHHHHHHFNLPNYQLFNLPANHFTILPLIILSFCHFVIRSFYHQFLSLHHDHHYNAT